MKFDKKFGENNALAILAGILYYEYHSIWYSIAFYLLVLQFAYIIRKNL